MREQPARRDLSCPSAALPTLLIDSRLSHLEVAAGAWSSSRASPIDVPQRTGTGPILYTIMSSSPKLRSNVRHRKRARERSGPPGSLHVESTTRSKNDPDYGIFPDSETQLDCETGDDLAEEYMRKERDFDESKETRRLYAKSSDGLICSMKRSWTRYITLLPPTP